MDLPEEVKMSGGGESPMEVLDKICEEMKNLLAAAEALLRPDEDDSMLEGREVEEA